MKALTPQRIFTYFIIGYVLLACAWWGYLLYSKNEEAFIAKKEKLVYNLSLQRNFDETQLERNPEYRSLENKHNRQKRMIIGEGLFFLLSLTAGIWLINQSFRREVAFARQQQNFLLSITHELKSPLASVKLILETIVKRNLEKIQINKFSTKALGEVDRLHQLVNNILLAARIEGSNNFKFEEVDMRDLVSEILDGLREKYPDVDFTLRQPEADVSIKCDKMGLTSVVLNLVENAVKYSPQEKEIEVNLYAEPENILLEVKDHGVGISEKEKKKIFDKFYRIGNENTRKSKGTGLGLYIVHEIVNAHKGEILVKDNTPKGTIFQVALPI